MKIFTKEIEKCEQCPAGHWNSNNEITCSGEKGYSRHICWNDFPEQIPDWCPLPDKEEQSHE